jgi:hypothetical protein
MTQEFIKHRPALCCLEAFPNRVAAHPVLAKIAELERVAATDCGTSGVAA